MLKALGNEPLLKLACWVCAFYSRHVEVLIALPKYFIYLLIIGYISKTDILAQINIFIPKSLSRLTITSVTVDQNTGIFFMSYKALKRFLAL